MGTATNVREAKALEDAGVQIIFLQGGEAGGHRGTWYDSGDWRASVTPLADLLPQVVAAVSVPVIAAGGIMDGAGIIRALAMGAEGAALGTAFLTTQEAAYTSEQKQALLERHELGTAVTRAYTGKPARGLRWPKGPVQELADVLVDDLPNYWFTVDCTDVVGAARKEGKIEWAVTWAGDNFAKCREVQPAASLFATLVREADEAAAKSNGSLAKNL